MVASYATGVFDLSAATILRRSIDHMEDTRSANPTTDTYLLTSSPSRQTQKQNVQTGLCSWGSCPRQID